MGNGVPLRRMNQRFVIATSTKIDVSGVDVKKIDDAFFKRSEAEKKKGSAGFLEGDSKAPLSAEKKSMQKTVDAAILKGIKEPAMKKYLGAKFALSSTQNAHDLIF